jgi:hypothetical protein
MNKADPIIQVLTRKGYKKDPQPKGYDEMFSYGTKNVALQYTHGGLWVWLTSGHKIQRRYLRTEEEIQNLALALQKG